MCLWRARTDLEQFTDSTGSSSCSTCSGNDCKESKRSHGHSLWATQTWLFQQTPRKQMPTGSASGVPMRRLPCVSMGRWAASCSLCIVAYGPQVFSRGGFWKFRDPNTGVVSMFRCADSQRCQSQNTCGPNRLPAEENLLCGQCAREFAAIISPSLSCSRWIPRVGWRVQGVHWQCQCWPGCCILFDHVCLGWALSSHMPGTCNSIGAKITRRIQRVTGYTRILLYFLQTAYLMGGSDSEVGQRSWYGALIKRCSLSGVWPL